MILEVEHLSFAYRPERPLFYDVSFAFEQGQVLSILGANGAGKSTLLNCIANLLLPQQGEIRLHGTPLSRLELREISRIIGYVPQSHTPAYDYTVRDFVVMGRAPHLGTFQQPGRADYDLVDATLEEMGLLPLANRPYTELSGGERQQVTIARVIVQQPELILLDEPTSVLNEAEVENLYKQMRKIAAQGHAVIFVSHHLNEILEVTDRIYVYKDGTSVGSLDTRDADEAKLYEMMVGQSTTTEYYHLDRQTAPQDDVLLEAKDLGLHGIFKHVNFQLHRGEVLGLCGVVGSGAEEVCEVLCGDEKPSFGEISVRGRAVRFRSPKQALREGILMIPKERLFEGIVSTLSVEDNIALSNAKQMAKGPFVSGAAVRRQAKHWIGELRIKTPGPQALLRQLSGGNQQKVVFSRALASGADILLLNHPTRGVDVGAKEEIYALIRDMTDEGKAVIVLGDTTDECIGLCSRLLVMKDGLVTGEFDAPADHKPSQVDVVSLMM